MEELPDVDYKALYFGHITTNIQDRQSQGKIHNHFRLSEVEDNG
jgi:hypothetical protein